MSTIAIISRLISISRMFAFCILKLLSVENSVGKSVYSVTKKTWKTCLRYILTWKFDSWNHWWDHQRHHEGILSPFKLPCLKNDNEDVWRQKSHCTARNRCESGACESFSQRSLRRNSGLSELPHGSIGQTCHFWTFEWRCNRQNYNNR